MMTTPPMMETVEQRHQNSKSYQMILLSFFHETQFCGAQFVSDENWKIQSIVCVENRKTRSERETKTDLT